MKINELSKLSGVSVRTLHHYDQIGLLRPQKNALNGYRDYSEADIDRLQQILLLRECGFALKVIDRMLRDPHLDQDALFDLQRKTLQRQQQKAEQMLSLLERTQQARKKGIPMKNQEKFQGFDFSQNPYEQEARKLWGDDPVNQSNAKISALNADEKQKLGDEFNQIFRAFSALRTGDPKGRQAQEQVKALHDHLATFGDFYTKEVFANLGEMYVSDHRFQTNIDQFGEGTAAFIHQAIQAYCQL